MLSDLFSTVFLNCKVKSDPHWSACLCRWSWSPPSAFPASTSGTSSQTRLCPRGRVTTGGWWRPGRTAQRRWTPSPTARDGSCGRVTAAWAAPSPTPSPSSWLWDVCFSDLRCSPDLFFLSCVCVMPSSVLATGHREAGGWAEPGPR